MTRLREHDICSTASSICSTLDGDTDVGTTKIWSVVSIISRHRTKMAEILETSDDLVFVLGEDASEAVCIENNLVEVLVLRAGRGAFLENLGRVHVVAEAETTASLLRNSELITGNHLNLDTECQRIVDRLLRVLTRRVENGKETDKLKAVALAFMVVVVELLVSDSECTETTAGELLNVVFETVLNLIGLIARAKFDDDSGHTLRDALELASRLFAVGNFGALVNGIEQLEVKELNASTGLCWIIERVDYTSVDGVLVLGTGRIGGKENDILGREGAVALHELLVDRELVGRERTRLVRAKDRDASQLLDSRDTSDDGLVLRELLRTNGECDGEHSGHGDWDTTDQEHEDVVEAATVRVMERRVEDDDLENNEDTDRYQAERTDLSENLLQVTGRVIVLANKGGSASEERVGTGRDNDTLSLALFANRTPANIPESVDA